MTANSYRTAHSSRLVPPFLQLVRNQNMFLTVRSGEYRHSGEGGRHRAQGRLPPGKKMWRGPGNKDHRTPAG